MARKNQFSGRKRFPEEPVEKLLETILEDVVQTAAMPFDDWWTLSEFPLTPLTIPVASGEQYRVTLAGIDAAHMLTEQTWWSREDFRQTISREEFDRLSFTAIGNTFQNAPAHLPKDVGDPTKNEVDDVFFEALAADYTNNLNGFAEQARSDIDRHVPCNLFHTDQQVSTFSVGPVEFLPRADWIDRFVTGTDVRIVIDQVETGKLHIDDLRERALKSGSARDLHDAWDVLSSLRGFSWVATIRAAGHELKQSHRKMSTIVGLAIDVIGLRFQVDDARRFTKAGRNHLFAEYRLATSVSGAFIRGSSVQVPGIGCNPGALAAKMAAERPFLDAAGRLLDLYVKSRQTGRAPHLIERWVNALYWIGEARREASDFVAVVNYGCAVDGLSGAGGNSGAMTRFAEAALNPTAEPTLANSLSISDAVKIVYREGRNNLAHGKEPGLFEDLTDTRQIGDTLLVKLFDPVTFELDNIVAHRPCIFDLDEKPAYRAFQERLRQRPQRAPRA